MVSNIVWNEKKPFNPATFENDFVILKLKGRLQFGDDVQPAYLPESHQIDLIKAALWIPARLFKCVAAAPISVELCGTNGNSVFWIKPDRELIYAEI